jgi:DNA primase
MSKKPFVDFRDVRARITMEQVLQQYNLLATFEQNGHTLIGPCPIHKGLNNRQFHVDTERNIWTCFSECTHAGNTLDFIAKMDNTTIHDAALKACEWFAIPLDEVEVAEDEQEEKTAAVHSIVTQFQPRSCEDKPNQVLKFKLDKLQRDHPYLTETRGLTQKTIIDFGLGYFTGKRGMMAGYVVIPIYNVKGELVTYVGRWPGEPPDNNTPKYKIPANFNMTQEVFNLDRASKEPGILVIVIGIFDAIHLHQHGCRKVVALMSNTMSATQEELIRQHTDSHAPVLILLNESAEGRIGRDNVALRLSRFCFVKVHSFTRLNMQPKHMTADEVNQLLQLPPSL